MSKIESKILMIVHIFVIGLFSLFVLSMSVLHIFTDDLDYSFSERRSLADMPTINLNLIKNADIAETVEKYLLDHFPSRDKFRAIKAGTDFYLLRRLDINGIYAFQGSLHKTEYPLRENKIEQAAELIELLSSNTLAELNSFYSVIPDKSVYLSNPINYPQLDQNKIEALMNNIINTSQALSLTDVLTIDHYYKTDLHWNQSKLPGIASYLAENMQGKIDGELPQYELNEMNPFLGSWYGRWTIGYKPDTLTWLSNETIATAEVYDHYDDSYHEIYELDAINKPDAYNIFLNGARPLLTITSEKEASETTNKLYIFRDSFGSSLAPLMLAYYDEIVLIDLRYISAAALNDYIDFTPGADVLFLFGSMTLNNSDMLKR